MKYIELPGTEIAADYKKGATLRQLADVYNVSIPKIQKTLEEQGVRRRSQGTQSYKNPRDERIKADYLVSGKSLRQLAREHNLSYQRISQIITEKEALPDERDIF